MLHPEVVCTFMRYKKYHLLILEVSSSLTFVTASRKPLIQPISRIPDLLYEMSQQSVYLFFTELIINIIKFLFLYYINIISKNFLKIKFRHPNLNSPNTLKRRTCFPELFIEMIENLRITLNLICDLFSPNFCFNGIIYLLSSNDIANLSFQLLHYTRRINILTIWFQTSKTIFHQCQFIIFVHIFFALSL